MGKVTNNKLDWSKLDVARAGVEHREYDPYPERSFTVQEYAERYSIPASTAHGQLRALVQRGVLEKGARVIVSGGHRCICKVFWLPE